MSKISSWSTFVTRQSCEHVDSFALIISWTTTGWSANTSACNISVLFDTIFLIELVNTSACLSCFLLSCVERMALGADFYMDALVCRTCHKCVAAVAGYGCLMVLRMDSFSHDFHLSISKYNIRIISKQLSHCIIALLYLQVLFLQIINPR